MIDMKNAKEIAEVANKVEAIKRDLKRKLNYLESDVLHGRDTTPSSLNVKYAERAKEKAENELDRLKR